MHSQSGDPKTIRNHILDLKLLLSRSLLDEASAFCQDDSYSIGDDEGHAFHLLRCHPRQLCLLQQTDSHVGAAEICRPAFRFQVLPFLRQCFQSYFYPLQYGNYAFIETNWLIHQLLDFQSPRRKCAALPSFAKVCGAQGAWTCCNTKHRWNVMHIYGRSKVSRHFRLDPHRVQRPVIPTKTHPGLFA